MSGMKGTHLTEKDIWKGPFDYGPNKTILYVCGSPQLAKDRWAQMGDPEHIRMGYPGMGICGEGFDEIILDEIYRDAKRGSIIRGRIDDWVDDVRCRLYPEGQMRIIRTLKTKKVSNR